MINQLYSSIYLGDSSIQRIYQGDDLIYAAERPDILCEWISNDSSTARRPDVYFDTGVYPNTSTSVEISYQLSIFPVPGVGDSTILFGCTHTTGEGFSFSGDFYLAAPYYRNSTFYAYRAAAFGSHDPQGTPDTNKHMLKVVTTPGTGKTYYDDSSISYAIASDTRRMEISAYLFGRHYNNTYNLLPQRGTRIYYCKVWEANNLIRFYIPVLHYTNGQYTPCFYDKVNDTYIYNLGTDTPTYKMSEDYLLDYIGSGPENAIPDNRQVVMRYDSGVVASNQLQTDMRGRLVWGRENYLFGSATSGQTTPTWQPYGYCTVGGSTDADKMRLRMGMGASSTSNYGMYLSTDASTVVGVNTLSTYYDANRGYAYLNGTRSNTSSPVPDTFSSNTIHLFSRHGDATNINALGGSRIYYINFTTSNIPTKTYVPVLHNGQAAFLDLNSGAYIYNIGTDAPYYILKS